MGPTQEEIVWQKMRVIPNIYFFTFSRQSPSTVPKSIAMAEFATSAPWQCLLCTYTNKFTPQTCASCGTARNGTGCTVRTPTVASQVEMQKQIALAEVLPPRTRGRFACLRCPARYSTNARNIPPAACLRCGGKLVQVASDAQQQHQQQ